MTETKLVAATAPGGETVVVPVVDLDGTAARGGEQKVSDRRLNLSDALKSIDDFTAGLRAALSKVTPDRTTVEFSVGFAVTSGKLTAMFMDGRVDGSVAVKLEWDK